MTQYIQQRIRFLFSTKSGSTPKSAVEEYWDGDIQWVTPEDLGKLKSRDIYDTRRKISLEGYRNSGVELAPSGSIVLSKRAPIGQTAILRVDATCNQGCFLLTPREGVNERFYYYCLISYRPAIEILGRGSTFMELSLDEMRSIRLPFLSLSNQILIANYLDRETTEIDNLIAEKEKMLALLEEKREALISRAVTRGLDSNISLKRSGIDWLGDIPKQWCVKKIGYLASLKSGEIISPEVIDKEGAYPVYGGNGLRGYTNSFTHTGDYVLIGRQGALCGNINYAHGSFWASEHAVVVTPLEKCDIRWLGETLRTMNLNQYSVSAAQPGIAIDRINAIKIPIPSLDEQQLISAYLDLEIATIEELLAVIRESISLLKERRSALITAAVIGQIRIEDMKA